MGTRVITDPLRIASYWNGSETYFALEAAVLRIREMRKSTSNSGLDSILMELESTLLTKRTGSVKW